MDYQEIGYIEMARMDLEKSISELEKKKYDLVCLKNELAASALSDPNAREQVGKLTVEIMKLNETINSLWDKIVSLKKRMRALV